MEDHVVEDPKSNAAPFAQPEDDEVESYNEYNPCLERDRRDNDQKLRSRFEEIFSKYERDFTGIADEIDLETGEIVVDNGHLEHMRDEGDAGRDDLTSKFWDADVGDEESEDDVESEATLEYEDSVIDPQLMQEPFLVPSFGIESQRDIETSAPPTVDSALAQIPAQEVDLRAFCASITEQFAQSTGVATPAAVQALQAIMAGQLAGPSNGDVTAQSAHQSERKRKLNVWDYPELPIQKRVQVSTIAPMRPQLPSYAAAVISSRMSTKAQPEPTESIWAPIRHPRVYRDRSGKAKRAALRQLDSAPQLLDGVITTQAVHEREGDQHIEPSVIHCEDSDGMCLKECSNCAARATPAWRRGPDGDICNACGMYFYRYGLMRPPRIYASPEPSDAEQDHNLTADAPGRPLIKTRRTTRFTVEEDALLIKLKEIDKMSWDKVGRHYVGRTPFAVQCRYSKKLAGRESAGRTALIEQGYIFDIAAGTGRTVDGPLFAREDKSLVQLREEYGPDWCKIAEHFPGQTAETIEARFDALTSSVVEADTDSVESKPKRKPKQYRPDAPERQSLRFTVAEVELLISLREVEQLSWEAVAARLPSRTALSLQKRYVRELAMRKKLQAAGGVDPYAHLLVQRPQETAHMISSEHTKKESFEGHGTEFLFTTGQDDILLKLRDNEGLDFVGIALHLPGKTKNDVTERYEALKKLAEVDLRSGAEQSQETVEQPSDTEIASGPGERSAHEYQHDTSTTHSAASIGDDLHDTDDSGIYMEELATDGGCYGSDDAKPMAIDPQLTCHSDSSAHSPRGPQLVPDARRDDDLLEQEGEHRMSASDAMRAIEPAVTDIVCVEEHVDAAVQDARYVHHASPNTPQRPSKLKKSQSRSLPASRHLRSSGPSSQRFDQPLNQRAIPSPAALYQDQDKENEVPASAVLLKSAITDFKPARRQSSSLPSPETAQSLRTQSAANTPLNQRKADLSWTEMLTITFQSCTLPELEISEVYKQVEGLFPYYTPLSGHYKRVVRNTLESAPQMIKAVHESRTYWTLSVLGATQSSRDSSVVGHSAVRSRDRKNLSSSKPTLIQSSSPVSASGRHVSERPDAPRSARSTRSSGAQRRPSGSVHSDPKPTGRSAQRRSTALREEHISVASMGVKDSPIADELSDDELAL